MANCISHVVSEFVAWKSSDQHAHFLLSSMCAFHGVCSWHVAGLMGICEKLAGESVAEGGRVCSVPCPNTMG